MIAFRSKEKVWIDSYYGERLKFGHFTTYSKFPSVIVNRNILRVNIYIFYFTING